MTVTPLDYRVLIEPLDPHEKKTESGLIYKKSNTGEPPVAKIIAISPDIEKPNFKVGDECYYSAPTHHTIRNEGKEYFIINHKELIAKR